MQFRGFRLATKLTQPGAELLLLVEREVLVSEKRDPSLGDCIVMLN
jgi:hypothetical protein